MPTKRTPAQRAQLKAIQAKKTKLADKYAFRLSPHIARWESEGLSDRQIVDLLNEAGAPVPSEYTGANYAPRPVKKWTLLQYRRLKERAAKVKEKMAWWARRNGQSHARPFGDGAGLFAYPYTAGLDWDPNKRRPGATEPLLPFESFCLPESIPELRRLWTEWDQLEAVFVVHKKKLMNGTQTPEDRKVDIWKLRSESLAAFGRYHKAEQAAWEAKRMYDETHPEEVKERQAKHAAEQARLRAEWLAEVLRPGSRASVTDKAMAEVMVEMEAYRAEKMKDPEYRRQEEQRRAEERESLSKRPTAEELALEMEDYARYCKEDGLPVPVCTLLDDEPDGLKEKEPPSIT